MKFVEKRDGIYIQGVSKPGMILFRADWCGHCKTFAPVFESIKRDINNEFLCIDIEDTQLQKTPFVSQRLAIRGYPTLMFFNEFGKITDKYTSDRSRISILKHICQYYHKCYN